MALYYDWGRAWYGDWATIHLRVELNAYRERERSLDRHVGPRREPDAIDAIEDILRERGERFIPVQRARPPRWMRHD